MAKLFTGNTILNGKTIMDPQGGDLSPGDTIIVRNGRLRISGSVPDNVTLIQSGRPTEADDAALRESDDIALERVMKRIPGITPPPADSVVQILGNAGNNVAIESTGDVTVTGRFGINGKIKSDGKVTLFETADGMEVTAANFAAHGKLGAGTYRVPEGGKISHGAVNPAAEFFVGEEKISGGVPRRNESADASAKGSRWAIFGRQRTEQRESGAQIVKA